MPKTYKAPTKNLRTRAMEAFAALMEVVSPTPLPPQPRPEPEPTVVLDLASLDAYLHDQAQGHFQELRAAATGRMRTNVVAAISAEAPDAVPAVSAQVEAILALASKDPAFLAKINNQATKQGLNDLAQYVQALIQAKA